METLIYVVSVSIINILCFFIGAKVGQKVSKGENIEIKSPVQIVKDYQEQKEIEEEMNKFKTISENIDNYDGTPIGQKKLE